MGDFVRTDAELLELLVADGTISAKGRKGMEEYLRKKWALPEFDYIKRVDEKAKALSQFQQEMLDWMPT